MDETQLAGVKRRIVDVRPDWLTEAGQKRRARRVARSQSAARLISASVGERAIAKQIARQPQQD